MVPVQVDRHAAPPRRRWVEARAEWARARRDDALARIDAAQQRYTAVRFVFSAAGHDRLSGGPLLAGALAFRLFLWMLPASLVVVGCLGFFSPGESRAAAGDVGLSVTASTFATASAQAHEGRWALLATGLFALFVASLSLARTLWLATILAWQLPIVKLRRPPKAAAMVVGSLVSALGLVLAANWLRGISYTVGVVVTVLLVVGYALLAWVILAALPRPSQVSIAGLLPGALLIGVGAEVLHAVAALFLAHQIASASELYGTLGSAATLMLWTYFLARVLIGGTAVNRAWATMLESRGEPAGNDVAAQRLSPRTALATIRETWRAARRPGPRGSRTEAASALATALASGAGTATMTVWVFDDARTAGRAVRRVVDLQRRGSVRVLGTGLVSWPAAAPRPMTRQAPSTNVGDALGGTFWGLLFGLVFYVPLTGPRSVTADAAVSGSLRGVGLGDDFVRAVRTAVVSGTSAVFLLVAGDAVEPLRSAMEEAPAVETHLTREQAARLREVFSS